MCVTISSARIQFERDLGFNIHFINTLVAYLCKDRQAQGVHSGTADDDDSTLS